MPIALKPGGRFPLVLNTDKDATPDRRPTFFFRFLNGEQWMDLSDIAESISQSSAGREALGKVYQALRMALIGWEHMYNPTSGEAIAFDPAKLQTIINPGEAQELLKGVMASIRPSEDERKN